MSAKSLFAIVLAAGQSRRFGTTKQLQEFAGLPLVSRAVRLAEDVCGCRSILVAGMDWQAVSAACAPMQGYLALNSEYASGMASSIACGVRAVANVADAILLLLADQPLITREHLQHLVSTWRESPGSVVTSAYAATTGPPVIFPRRDFAALQSLHGDRGAHSVLESAAGRVVRIEFADASLDIDRPEDLPAGY